MTSKHNIETVAIGAQVDATTAKRPQRIGLDGRVVSVVPLDAVAHAETLYEASRGERNEGLWRYLFEGPFATRAAFDAHLRARASSEDPLLFAIVEKSTGDAVGSAVGYARYMRIEPAHRVIEVGRILFTPRLQRTVGATESMYLIGSARFRRPRIPALRTGFTFEGIFRQH
jgi:RimJ/RimL family protein N-acetyltransferase